MISIEANNEILNYQGNFESITKENKTIKTLR